MPGWIAIIFDFNSDNGLLLPGSDLFFRHLQEA